jgi:chemosensory pili system protein ChpA (sensor histidine kinase/response regulator)
MKLKNDLKKEIKKIWLVVRSSSPEAKLGAYLEFKGYQLNRATPEVEAVSEFLDLEEIEVFNPDFVLLQAGQPGFDGFELCRQIKANHRLRNVPVILFGTENSTQSAVKAYRAGVQYYVALAGEDYFCLLRLIEKLSGKRRASQQLKVKAENPFVQDGSD